MGVTGIVLMVFVFGHAIGNLKMYLGPAEFNHYSEFLRELLVPILPRTVTLWLIRIGLIVAFVGHIFAAASLTAQNRKANVPYQSRRDYLAANFAARTMRWTGVIILLFLIFHLADLTWGLKPIATEQWTRGLAYKNVTESLQRVGVAIFYILANIALGIHLFHGSWSLFQSLGFNNPRFNNARRYFATGFAVLIAASTSASRSWSWPASSGTEEPNHEHHPPRPHGSSPAPPPDPSSRAGTSTSST